MDDDAPTAEQVAIFRRMSPAEKLEAALRLYWSARELKVAGLRAMHPDWPDERVEREARDAFLFHRD